MRLVHELVIRKGFPSCFQATEEKQGEAEAVKRKLRETAQSKLRNPPSQVSSPSACDNPNLPPGNASSLFQSPPQIANKTFSRSLGSQNQLIDDISIANDSGTNGAVTTIPAKPTRSAPDAVRSGKSRTSTISPANPTTNAQARHGSACCK
ncbi:hypothetical protein HAV15_006609 [Penicillium sp. str. |nr:hypothetical protein HAV15_006609 [Penicillium sp. str. \